MFKAVLLLLYATALISGGFGHPFGGFWRTALEVWPPEAVVKEERPEVTKSKRGEDDLRSRGMKAVVKTWVLVTLTL
jgi:hypothetical protein